MKWKTLATLACVIWLILGVGKDLFNHQDWHDVGQVAHAAHRTHSGAYFRLGVCALLLWHITPMPQGKGGGDHR
jgi:hypothetical protein